MTISVIGRMSNKLATIRRMPHLCGEWQTPHLHISVKRPLSEVVNMTSTYIARVIAHRALAHTAGSTSVRQSTGCSNRLWDCLFPSIPSL